MTSDTRRDRKRLRIAASLAALALAACASVPPGAGPTVTLYQQWGQGLEIAVSTYTEAMVAAGRAHAAGTITDAQLEQIRVAGRATEQALRAASASLSAVAAGGQGDVASAVLDAQRAVLALLRATEAARATSTGPTGSVLLPGGGCLTVTTTPGRYPYTALSVPSPYITLESHMEDWSTWRFR